VLQALAADRRERYGLFTDTAPVRGLPAADAYLLTPVAGEADPWVMLGTASAATQSASRADGQSEERSAAALPPPPRDNPLPPIQLPAAQAAGTSSPARWICERRRTAPALARWLTAREGGWCRGRRATEASGRPTTYLRSRSFPGRRSDPPGSQPRSSHRRSPPSRRDQSLGCPHHPLRCRPVWRMPGLAGRRIGADCVRRRGPLPYPQAGNPGHRDGSDGAASAAQGAPTHPAEYTYLFVIKGRGPTRHAR
jgi:hypothetical protein